MANSFVGNLRLATLYVLCQNQPPLPQIPIHHLPLRINLQVLKMSKRTQAAAPKPDSYWE